MEQLKYPLQLLALPVSGQVRLIADDYTRVETLTQAFQSGRQAVHREMADTLSVEQRAAIGRLDSRLRQLRLAPHSLLCGETALRRSPEWREVKQMARNALVSLDWTLEVPPPGAISPGVMGQDEKR